jgi:hypothetical protein
MTKSSSEKPMDDSHKDAPSSNQEQENLSLEESVGGSPFASDTFDPKEVLVTIGDLACTRTEVITPNGTYPLASTNWIVTNNSTTREKIPTKAIVLAICFAVLCLIGLLFLLMKEKITEGYVQVTVQSDEFFYSTQIPVQSPQEILDVEQKVNYARGLVRGLA